METKNTESWTYPWTREKDALMMVIHGVLHQGCSDRACIDDIYTGEDIADAIIADGWHQ